VEDLAGRDTKVVKGPRSSCDFGDIRVWRVLNEVSWARRVWISCQRRNHLVARSVVDLAM